MKPKDIETFSVDGIARDQESIIRIRVELEHRIIEQMREKGYVPILDITPELYWEYINDGPDKEKFKFLLVLYGTHVGEKSNQIMGMLGPHAIMFEPFEEKINDNSE